jgi:aminodeoxychorismate synthase component I
MILAREAEYFADPLPMLRAAGAGRFPALFHSSPELARYSILAVDPYDIFVPTRSDPAPFGRFKSLLTKRIATGDSTACSGLPFIGGAAGFLGYEMGGFLEILPEPRQDRLSLPLAQIGFYSGAYVADHLEKRGWIAACSIEDAPAAEKTSEALGDLIEAAKSCGTRPLDPVEDRLPEDWPRLFDCDASREDYQRAVARILDYILAGDIYQANYTFRLSRPFERSGVDLFEVSTQLNPSPYSAYLAGNGFEIVSASPELLLRVEGRRAVTRPIKGTIRRSSDPAEDALRAERLRSNEKDAAENIMIVDLERNDLGRVCEFGSVRASRLLEIESFPNVHHLVSTVEGRLREGAGALEAFMALFPGGSITGAPKIRAMEIIHELEPVPRNVYTGAIGFFDARGGAAFNIAIRTMTVAQGRVWFNVGGGIVADSTPESEYAECLSKGRAMARAIECLV